MIKKLFSLWGGKNKNILSLYEKAIATHRAGQLDEAQQQYETVLQHEPRHAESLAMLGTIALQRGNAEAALKYINQSLAIDDNQPEAYCNRGFSMTMLNRLEEALLSYERAIELKPDFAQAYTNHGNLLRDLKRPDAALLSYERAIAINPNFAMAHNSHGAVLKDLNRPAQALLSYDRAIALAPDYAEAYYNKGVVQHESLDFNEALENYNKAILLKSNYVDAFWNKALLLIIHGYYEEGWQLYESRHQKADMAYNYLSYTQPLWLGQESPAGKTILIYAEQGLGDTIQFCRYIPILEKLGANILLLVQPSLIALLGTLNGKFTIVNTNDPLPHCDWQCPLMSLPLAFHTLVETIPVTHSYLSVDAAKRTTWSNRLGVKNKPRIGLAWSGAVKHLDDHNRSLQLEQLIPILDLPFEFHSLQKEVRNSDWDTFNQLTQSSHIQSHHDELGDFSDTAALAEQMDVIISVDTSVAHLAAALGKKVFILLPYFPDYRWMLHRSDSPWYPTATLFRQTKKGDWNPVIHAIKSTLKVHLNDIRK